MASDTYGTSTVTLHRSLISGNTAANSGGEVYRYDYGGSFLVDDFNLFGHGGITTAVALDGVTAGGSDILATMGETDATALADILDPTLMNNGGPTLTHNLVTDSPAIDAAGACGSATDQRGFVRNVGDCDIGAVEFGAAVPGSDPCDTATPTLGCTVNGVLNQSCQGGPGKDVIVGGGGNHILKGNAGNDLLCGEAGNDRLFGGSGDDTLVGGDGTDKLKGDGGTDSCDGETEITCEL